MDSLVGNKWSILLAVQMRLDADAVGKYEAMLAMYALRLLFPEHHGGQHIVPTADALWPLQVHAHLCCIVDGGEWSHESREESWLAMWNTLRTTDKFISTQGVAELLGSAAKMEVSDHVLQSVQSEDTTSSCHGQDTARDHTADNAGGDAGSRGDT